MSPSFPPENPTFFFPFQRLSGRPSLFFPFFLSQRAGGSCGVPLRGKEGHPFLREAAVPPFLSPPGAETFFFWLWIKRGFALFFFRDGDFQWVPSFTYAGAGSLLFFFQKATFFPFLSFRPWLETGIPGCPPSL